MPQIFRLAGVLFLVLAVAAIGLGVVLFLVGRASVGNMSPVEGHIGLLALGIVALSLYGLSRLCGRLAARANDQTSRRRAA